MRVISGTARGTRLQVPPRVTRPSTDRLREALFSILANRVVGASVLDLFAGSGALGIEALSRGAARAVFVEEHWKACKVIGDNLARAGLEDRATVRRGDAFRLLTGMSGRFDLIFADPPYLRTAGRDDAEALLGCAALPGLLEEEGLLVMEVESEREAPEQEGWELCDRRRYGGSTILFYALEGCA